MTTRRPGRKWAALGCALLVCGCSASKVEHAASDRATGAVRLSPDPAFAAAQLAVSFSDPRMRAEDYRIEWLRNGTPVAGATGPVLDPSLVAKGDRIEVRLTPTGAGAGSGAPLHAEVRVVNSPPTLSRVAILATGNSGRAELQATVVSADPDRDALSYTYRWYRNGQQVSGASGASLAADPLASGDAIAVEVTASDGASRSAPLRSEPYSLENRPPHFTSTPTAPRPSDEAFRYQALAVDPDGDPVRYELVSGPGGMDMDASGAVSWRLPTGALRRGTYPVTIRATDPKGDQGTQQFTIDLDSPVAAR